MKLLIKFHIAMQQEWCPVLNQCHKVTTGVTLPVLNQFFSRVATVMHLGETNCYLGLRVNLINGSVLNQSFSSGAIVMHLGPWGNLISAKLILQWRHLSDLSAMVLNGSFNGQAQSPRRCWPCSMVLSLLGLWQSFDRFFVNVLSLSNYADV